MNLNKSGCHVPLIGKVMFRTAICWAIFSSTLGTMCSATAAAPVNASAPLKCESGPLNRVFGKTPWLVYGCVDARSMVVVSAPGSPAFPFYFMVFEGANGYEVAGEGTGKKEATAAAHSELKALTAAQIKALIAEAAHVKQ